MKRSLADLAQIAPRSPERDRTAPGAGGLLDRSAVDHERGYPASLSVGERLRHLRTDRRLTQRQLAERACISLEAVWTIENDRKRPRRSTALLLARALGVGPAELLPV